MKQVLAKKGTIVVNEVPAPLVADNCVLVKVCYSCISAGTEVTSIASTDHNLIQKVLSQPDKIKKVFQTFKKEGLERTIQKIRNKIDQETPLGYSAAGIIIEIGKNITDFRVGDRVACAGAGIANHAEYIDVPQNLTVKMPDSVSFQEASTVTLGAIAMQGVRRANVALGEQVAVIGLGILGQITCQLLKANGCHVIGIDLDERRIKKALEAGIDHGLKVSTDIAKTVISCSGGFGVDTVIVTAATGSNEPLSQAFQICRKKGRVILVGSVGMQIKREDMYEKELDFLIATSYGPGRYDEDYEAKGLKYPYAYIRWTETRNMGEYLRLIESKKINIPILIEKEFPIENAEAAYSLLQDAQQKPLIVLLKYESEKAKVISRTVLINPISKKTNGRINIALIGAGDFASAVHLPNLMKLSNEFRLTAICSRTGAKAKTIANRFGAEYATTDYKEVLKDKNIDAVIIATRHDLHATMAMEALKSGKAVLLEKPMALNQVELDCLVSVIEETKMPFMVGFNRRFSPYAQFIKKHVEKRINPMIINYQMNAGYIPLDHWVHLKEGGGRIIGEACHIFDLFSYFVGFDVKSFTAEAIEPKSNDFKTDDNKIITLKYSDGSVCNLIYTALGSKQYFKESCSIYFDGKMFVMNDFQEIKGFGVNADLRLGNQKGQFEELKAFAAFLKGNEAYPIPIKELAQTTEVSFKVA